MVLELEDALTGLTIITLLTVVIGDRVLGWLKTRGVDLSKLGEIYELAYNTQQTAEECLKRLDDGKLEEAILSLSKNVSAQTDLLREMVSQAKLQREEHKLILDQMERIGNR